MGDWNSLSMRDKRDVMRLHIKNGIMDLNAIRENYNSFADGGDIKVEEPTNTNNTKVDSISTANNIVQENKIKKSIEMTPNQFYSEYIGSPMYLKRLSGMGYKNPNKVANERLSQLNKQKITYNNLEDSHWDRNRRININKQEIKQSGLSLPYTIAHEESHAAGSMGNWTSSAGQLNSLTLNKRELDEIGFRNELNKIDMSKISDSMYPVITHDKIESESKADMDALRYLMKKDGLYDASSQVFTEKNYNDAIKKYGKKGVGRFFKNFNKKNAIWMFNNIAQNNQEQLPDNFLNNNII